MEERGTLERMAGLDSLVAVVDVGGHVLQSNHLQGANSLLDLVSERDRDNVRALLLSCGFSSQPTRVQVSDLRGRSGWMELAAAGSGEVSVLWLTAEVIAPAATPASPLRIARPEPAPPPRAPAPTVAYEYAVVADPEQREIAANLRRALDTVSSSVGVMIVPEVSGNLGAAGSDTRILILGNSRYTGFLRKLAGEPAWAHYGVCWARSGRRAAIWYQDPGAEPTRELAEQEAALDALLREVASGRKDTQVVQAFLDGFDLGVVERRLSRWPRRLRYILGVARFLLDGFPLLAARTSPSTWKD